MFGAVADEPAQVEHPLPALPDWTVQQKLAGEKEVLGIFVTGHPLDEFSDKVTELGKHDTETLEGLERGTEVAICGILTGITRKRNKEGKLWAAMRVEDRKGGVEAMAFSCLLYTSVLLIGQLGAGKTTLAKGIVKGLGGAAPDDVSSPTFTLIHEYSPSVYHIDLYRLDTAAQVATLGLDEIFDRPAVVLIEWGERFPELMPEERAEIRLRATGECSREIAVQWNQSSPL